MDSFPSVSQFKQAVYLRTIAHAISIAQNPLLAYEVAWDGDVFLLNNSLGATAALYFGEPFVGVFCDLKSLRNPYLSDDEYTWQSRFSSAPTSILDAAFSKTLQYMLDNYRGSVVPIITTAVWSKSGQLSSDDNWDAFVRHGGHLISPYLNPLKSIQRIAATYNFSAQMDLLMRLYNRRIAQNGDILLTENDLQDLFSQGDAGAAESENLLKSIGILFS